MARPGRESLEAKPEQTRSGNDRIARGAARHRFDRTARVPFLCECDDWGCAELIRLTLPQYEVARAAGEFIAVAGHAVAGAEVVRGTDEWCVLRRDAAS